MKPKRIRTGPASFYYEYNGWHISPQGGFITMRRYECRKGGKYFWVFYLRDVVPFSDALDAGDPLPTNHPKLHLEPLYQ